MGSTYHYEKAAAEGRLPTFPEGFVPLAEAARSFGVTTVTWKIWENKGRVAIPRYRKKLTAGPPWVLYKVEDLERLREQFRNEPPPSIPAGYVTQREAAKRLGIGLTAWGTWERSGRIAIPRTRMKVPHGPPLVLYAVADLEPLREHLRKLDEERDRLPEGLLTREQAADLFDFNVHWFDKWTQEVELPVQPVWVPRSGSGPLKMYPRDELIAFRDQWRRRFEPYPDPERPGCYRVPLVYMTYEPREAIIDEVDLPLVQGKSWHWEERTEGLVGTVALASAYGQNTPLKRLLMGVANPGNEMRVTHRNGDPLDCRRCNLEVIAPDEQVHRNRKMGTVNGRKFTSQYKGVCWDEKRGAWKAQIRKGDYYRSIGRFDDEEDAARAYDNAARELFGEHASLNFPEEGERGALGVAA